MHTYFVSCMSGSTSIRALASIGKAGAQLVHTEKSGQCLIMEIRCTKAMASHIHDGYRDGILVYDTEGVRVP
jgi:hypothetical protein